MASIIDSFQLTFRDFETPNLPSSGQRKVWKADARALGGVIEQAVNLVANGAVIGSATLYATKAAMDADYATGAVGRLALVYADSTAANNKIWVKGASAWVDAGMTLAASAVAQLADLAARVADLETFSNVVPYALADAAGTPDALVLPLLPALTTLKTGAVIFFRVLAANAGAVTLTPNGLATRDLRGFTGGALVAGDLQPNRVYAARYTGARWDLIAGTVGVYTAASAGAIGESAYGKADILQRTRIHPRPVEDPASWSAAIGDHWATAPELELGGDYVAANSPYGRVVSVGASAHFGPIGFDLLEPGQVYVFRWGVVRSVNDVSNNAVFPRLRAFNAAGEEIGFVGLPSRTVLAADGLVEFSHKISLDPELSDYGLPAGTRYLRRYFVTPGDVTNGRIGLLYIERDVDPQIADDLDEIRDELDAGLGSVNAEIDMMRRLQVVPRPADDPQSWTIEIAERWETADELELGGTYVVAPSDHGALISIGASGRLGPIAEDLIEPGAVYEYRFGLKRLANDPANNAAYPRLRCFGGNHEDLGFASLAGVNLTVADGFVVQRYRISTDAAKSDVSLPAGTCSVRRYFVTPSETTTGRVGLAFIERDVVTGAGLDDAEDVATLEDDDRIVVLRGADGEPVTIPYSDLKTLIGEIMAGPPLYSFPAHTRAGKTPIAIIPDDGGNLKEFSIYNSGSATLYVSQGGLLPGPGAPGTYTLLPGEGVGQDINIPGAVMVRSDGLTAVTCYYKTTNPVNLVALAAAERYVAKALDLGIVLSDPMKDALRALYSALYGANAFSVLGEAYVLSVPGQAGLINLADLDDDLAEQHGGAVRVPWRHTLFDGETGWIDTRSRLSAYASADDHSLWAFAGDGTVQGSSRAAIGDATVTLTPNRSNGSIGIRSLTPGVTLIPGVIATPDLVSMSRLDEDRVVVRKGQTFETTVDVPIEAGMASRNLLIGARNAGKAGGEPVPAEASFYLGPLVFVASGRRGSGSLHRAIDAAIKQFVITTGDF